MADLGSLLIVGAGSLFERALAQWRQVEPERDIRALELEVDEIAALADSALAPFPPEKFRIFAAIDSTALNFARLDLFTRLRLRGYRAATFIHPSARIDSSAQVAENCFIAEGATIGPKARIAYNCHVGAGTTIGFMAELQPSCWLDAGVLCGDRCSIGTHSIVGPGTVIGHGVKVGSHCALEVRGHHASDVPGRTYMHPLFDRPVRILSA